MTKQVNVRLSAFHQELIKSIMEVHGDMGLSVSQAKVIESALDQWVMTEPNLKKAVSEKMDLGIFK